jgi:antirestriction protein ArdC
MASQKAVRNLNRAVDDARKRGNVKTHRGRTFELSGIAHGEEFVFGNSLVHTARRTGAWREVLGLDDKFINKTASVIRKRM